MLVEYTITLRTDHDDKAKDELMLQAMKEKAREMFTVATLIADRRKPTICLETGDLFVAESEISVLDPEPTYSPE